MSVGIVLAVSVRVSAEENKIQAFVAQNGKIVFTNVADNSSLSARSNPQPAPQPSGPAPIPGSDPIHALIESIASNHGVDPALVKAMVKTESNYNRWARSNRGALGLMQLIPDTGARFGVRDFFDPKQNIEGGVSYLRFLLEKFNGDLDLSLAAYNAGENLVEKLGRIPSIPETRDYVRKVRAHYGKPGPVQLNAVQPAPVEASAKPETKQIFRTVDEHGVIHYSNIAPPK